MKLLNFEKATELQERYSQHQLDVDKLSEASRIAFFKVAQGGEYAQHVINIKDVSPPDGEYYSRVQSELATELKRCAIQFYEQKSQKLLVEFEGLE